MEINDLGLQLIKTFEGFRSAPYTDMVGHVTIGYGTTFYADGSPVTMDDSPIDEPTASALMQTKLNTEFCPGVTKLITVTVTDNQFSAMICLAYNIGLGNFTQSTVLRCNNARNWQDAAQSFLLWNKAGGEVMPGLTRRRQAESTLYLTGL